MSLDESPRMAARQTFPATAWQTLHWRAHKEFARKAALNVAMRWRLEGLVSDSALETAVRALAARHEILRTRFEDCDGVLTQIVEPLAALRVAHIDLQRLAPEAQALEIERIGSAEARAVFDLAKGPLLRALLVRTAPTSAVLHLTFHHLTVDGWSIGLLAEELLSLLVEPSAANDLISVDLHYGDYARWQQAVAEAGAFESDLAYWRRALLGVSASSVHALGNYERTGEPDDAGFIRSQVLPRGLTEALVAHGRRRGQTMFVTACAALARMLAQRSGRREIVIGVQSAGRSGEDAERIVGPLLNTLLLRLPIARGALSSHVEDVTRTIATEALAHATAPFARVAEASGLEPRVEAPLGYDVNFVLQSANIHAQSAEHLRRGALELVSLPSTSPGALWPLNFFMVERADGYRISCEADAAMFSPASVDAMIEAWRSALEETLEERPQPSAPGAPPGPKSAAAPMHMPVRRERRVVALQVEGERAPVFALNIASIYFPLAKRLGPERPFYDVRLCPASKPSVLADRYFPDIARDAVDLIRAERPHGPYVLFGLCVAGALAIEAARLLRAAGEDVPLVVLADTWRPGYRESMGPLDRFERAWRVRIARWRTDFARVRDGRQTLAYTLNTYPSARLLRLSAIAAALKLSPPASGEDFGDHELRWFADHLGAAQTRFRPEPFEGRVLVLRSREPLTGRLFAHDLGWGGFVRGGLEVVECPGEHATMFREAGAIAIAKAMRRCFADLSC